MKGIYVSMSVEMEPEDNQPFGDPQRTWPSPFTLSLREHSLPHHTLRYLDPHLTLVYTEN